MTYTLLHLDHVINRHLLSLISQSRKSFSSPQNLGQDKRDQSGSDQNQFRVGLYPYTYLRTVKIHGRGKTQNKIHAQANKTMSRTENYFLLQNKGHEMREKYK